MPYLKEKVFYVQYISTIKKDCINKFRVIFGVILSSVLTFSYRKVFCRLAYRKFSPKFVRYSGFDHLARVIPS